MAPVFRNDYSITKMFYTKDVRVFVDERHSPLIIHLKTIGEILDNQDWSVFYSLVNTSGDDFQNKYGLSISSSYEFFHALLFSLGQFDAYRKIYDIAQAQLTQLIEGLTINRKTKALEVKLADGFLVTITEEIWNYVWYIIHLSYGEKVNLPPIFDSEEAKQFYLAQKKLEDKIKKVKSAKEGDSEGLIKMFLSITYAFPSITFDYLFNQTLAQIQWLQKYAAESMSYEVNAKAFAAGNMKKGKKLDFFIK